MASDPWSVVSEKTVKSEWLVASEELEQQNGRKAVARDLWSVVSEKTVKSGWLYHFSTFTVH